MNQDDTPNVDVHDGPQSNMFGCPPCPACGGLYRWPSRHDHPKHPDSVVCDDCGHVEPIRRQVS